MYFTLLKSQNILVWIDLYYMKRCTLSALQYSMNYRASLWIKQIPPIIFLETTLPFPTVKVPSQDARRNPVPKAVVCTRRDPAKPQAAWWHKGTAHPHPSPGPELYILQQGWITDKITSPFLCLHKISGPFLIFSFRWLLTKLPLALKLLWTFASLGGIHGAPGSHSKQRSHSQLGQDTLQDQTFRNPIHWIDAVADTMLGTHVKIEMLLKMFNLVRQISKNLCKTI